MRARPILLLRFAAALVSATSLASPAIAELDIDRCTSVRAKSVERIVLHPGDGKGARVEGLLRKPKAAGRHPAVVFLHGNGGLRPPRCYEWALERFTGWGYVTLVVDSLSWRRPSGGYSFADQAQDAALAHRALARMRFVDSSRVGLVGYSRGGMAALMAISAEASPPDSPVFQVAVVYYPFCHARITLRAPLLVLIGEADRITPAAACHSMKVTALGHAYELKTYPEAGHLFDLPWWPDAYRAEDSRDAVARTKEFLAKYLAATRP